MKSKGRVLFEQYIRKKRKHFGIKMFKLCDSTGYTYDMNVYLGKDRQRAAQHLTATHTTVTNVTRGVEGFGHKLYMDNFFSSLSCLMTWPRKNADRMANSYTVSRRTWKWTKKTLFRPVKPGHCQQLHPLIFMWWEENITQRFLTRPYQRDAGTVWA